MEKIGKSIDNGRWMVENPFVSEERMSENLTEQIQMVPVIITQFKKYYNVIDDTKQRLEYFFYTNTIDKAQALAEGLKRLRYIGSFGISAGKKNLFIITGKTPKIAITNDTIVKWVKKMCQKGYQYDCGFDGWGVLI
jgi:hypothetical protein